MSEQTVQPAVEALGDGRYLVRDAGRQFVAHAVSSHGQVWVWLDGNVHVFGTDETGGGGRIDAEMAMASPMPATVRAIRVAVGQSVSSGDPLVVLEAMKMELLLSAQRSGTVRAIRCSVGDLVQPGHPLVEIG